MLIASELLAAAIAALVFLVGVLVIRTRSRRTRNVGRSVVDGPPQLRFTCAVCGKKFTHSRRTLAEWRTGSRAFSCNACRTKVKSEAQTMRR